MKKISYRLVYNRKKHLNRQGKALIQIEAYLPFPYFISEFLLF